MIFLSRILSESIKTFVLVASPSEEHCCYSFRHICIKGFSVLVNKFPSLTTADDKLKEIRDLKKSLLRKKATLPKAVSDLLHASATSLGGAA